MSVSAGPRARWRIVSAPVHSTAIFAWLVLLVLLPTGAAGQSEPAVPNQIVVATRHVPPFAIKDEEGNWSGITIELIREIAVDLADADDNVVELEFREMALGEMLEAVERGEVDLAAAALTVNFDREEKMDFSHPYHTSGLGIAAAGEKRTGWRKVGERIFSITFLRIVAALFGLLVFSGMLLYFVERRANKEQFGGGFWRGLGAGVWWSIVTLTTVGYGDKAPQTFGGRCIAVLWMFSGILVISAFTAAVTSTLTLGQLTSRVTGPTDLTRVSVATVSDSTSQSYLMSRNIRHQRVSDLPLALSMLDRGDVDAVVYDAPILRFQVMQDFPKLHVLPAVFDRQDYAIALPSGSSLRETINRAVLRVISKRSWQETLRQYLGETE